MFLREASALSDDDVGQYQSLAVWNGQQVQPHIFVNNHLLLKVEAPKHEEFYMERIFLILLLAGLYGLAAIDSFAQKTVKFEMQESQARVLDVNPSTYVKPVIAELSVDTSKGRLHDTWTLDANELAARVIKNDDKATLQNLRTYAVYKSAEK